MARDPLGTPCVNVVDGVRGWWVEERDSFGADVPTFASLSGLVGPGVVRKISDDRDGAAFDEILSDASREL